MTEFYQPKPPCPSPGKGTTAANLPHSKARQAWRRSERKLLWDSAGTLAGTLGLGSREDAALHWLELAGLTPSSARRRRPGTGNPHLRGAEPARERFPVSLRPGGAPGVGRGPAARGGPVGEGTAHLSLPVAEVRRGGARTRRAERSRLWRPEHQVELAPHVAGRASFTAWRGGGGAERARGSCDRRLAKYRPSTADVCACAPLLALSPHLGGVETG